MIAVLLAPVWRRLALALLGAAALAGPGVASAEAQPLPATPAHNFPSPPQDLFDGLFVAVQSAGAYADGKTFADAIPDDDAGTDSCRLPARAAGHRRGAAQLRRRAFPPSR